MTAPAVGACAAWTDDVSSCCPGLSDDVDPDIVELAATFATNVLFRLSGRQFPGECEETVRPCYARGSGCGNDYVPWGSWSFWWWDALSGNVWSAFPVQIGAFWPLCGPCAGRCNLPSVILPAPVSEITEVVIDGEVLDSDAYKVINFRELVRIDGDHWPCSQDMRHDSAVGSSDPSNTWQVTYTYGRGPGADGVWAAQRFACELAKLWCGATDCQLLPFVKQIAREGITIEVNNPQQWVSLGRTGLYDVDAWLQSVNPQRIQRRARVSRMGDPRRYKTFTWP